MPYDKISAMRNNKMLCLIGVAVVSVSGCGKRESSTAPGMTSVPVSAPTAPPAQNLPPAGPALTDFSCSITAADVPDSVNSQAEPVKIHVSVTNTSKETWPALLPGRSEIRAVNIAFHLDHGNTRVSEGTRALLKADLKPGERTEVELQLTPLPKAGDYTLRVEPVQEAVGWFGDNNKACQFSRPLNVK